MYLGYQQSPHSEFSEELLYTCCSPGSHNQLFLLLTFILESANHVTRVSHYKYLRLNFSDDLSWSHHIQIQCKKSCKLTRVLFRNFYAYCNVHTLHVLFKTVIMLHLEYGCVVWDPHLLRQNSHRECSQGCFKGVLKAMES